MWREGAISSLVKDQAKCVIVGSWNIAILNPDWLAKEVFQLPENTNFDVEVAIDSSIGLRAKISDLYIAPASNRLTIYPAKEDTNLFQLIDVVTSRIFEKLPYTPINAIGHNFVYELEDTETFKVDVLQNSSYYQSLYNEIGCGFFDDSLLRHSLSLKGDLKVRLNLSYKIVDSKKVLDFNYHYQANRDAETIAYALKRCFINFEHSKLLTDYLIERR